MSYEYDVALSFAGEDRKFVEDCAEILRSLNINVFYDNYEKEVLLGKNLYSYLVLLLQIKSKPLKRKRTSKKFATLTTKS